MIAGTTTWGSKLQTCAMHIAATSIRPCNGVIAERMPLHFRIVIAGRIHIQKRQLIYEEQPVPLSRLCCTYLTHNGLQRCGPFCYAGEHDGFAESVCSGLRPQKPWRRVVVA
jgi:hypothetical protein